MVSSAVLGAATGTGLALVVAMTIVIYRYYAVKRKGKHWSSLDQWPDPPSTSLTRNQEENESRHQHYGYTGCTSDNTRATNALDYQRRKPHQSYYAVQHAEFNIVKEQHAIQPSSALIESSMGLPHQSRSYPGGGYGGGGNGRILSRNPSVTSQDFPDGNICSSPKRGSSPQIRAYGPDGRHQQHEILHSAASYPPGRGSRSPSPARAASLDARCRSPSCFGSLPSGTASPSQTSLSSLATAASSSGGSSTSARRCLSPLLIPQPRPSICDGGMAPPASPLGSLQPDLYQRHDGPLILDTPRSGTSIGQLHLKVKYDYDKSDLHVHLIEARDLTGSNQGGFNDPYVKLTLSPHVDSKKRETCFHHNDATVFYDENFKFPVSHEELQDKTLVLQVFDYDRFSRNDVVGSVRVVMGNLELSSSSSPIEIWGHIAKEPKPREEMQEVLLDLLYLPSAERLEVIVLKARNLFPLQGKETLDPFVKVSLLTDEKRGKKKKTSVKKSTNCPIWNEAMNFDVPASALATTAIKVCVQDASEVGGNPIVGSCIVGPGIGSNANMKSASGNQGKEHWLQMTHSERKGVTMWHTLH